METPSRSLSPSSDGTPGERQLDRHTGSTDDTQSKRTPVDHPFC
jgi:hypothetical protein